MKANLEYLCNICHYMHTSTCSKGTQVGSSFICSIHGCRWFNFMKSLLIWRICL